MTDLIIFHDSHEELYRFPFGAAPCSSKVNLGLTVQTLKPVSSAEVVISSEGGIEQSIALSVLDRQGEKLYYSANADMPQEPGLIWYYFMLVIGGEKHYYGNNEKSLGGVGRVYSTIPPGYQITVYLEEAKTPHWYKKAIMYQIFADRFRNGSKDGKVQNPKKNSFVYANWGDIPTYIKDCDKGAISRWDFFGGNLQGVMDKLEYLKELGIAVIYLNPIFEAASNHKYDTGDYKRIDPMFGSNESTLCLAATRSSRICAKRRKSLEYPLFWMEFSVIPAVTACISTDTAAIPASGHISHRNPLIIPGTGSSAPRMTMNAGGELTTFPMSMKWIRDI